MVTILSAFQRRALPANLDHQWRLTGRRPEDARESMSPIQAAFNKINYRRILRRQDQSIGRVPGRTPIVRDLSITAVAPSIDEPHDGTSLNFARPVPDPVKGSPAENSSRERQ